MFKAPTITFDPAELGEEAFGWNFPLGLLIPALFARARELGVTFTGSDAAAAQVFRWGEHHDGRWAAARGARRAGRGRPQFAAARGGRDPHQPLGL